MTTWREALEQYYQTHETLNEENRAWLKSHVLMDVDLIADMTREQVLATFSRNGKFNHTLFVLTMIWQALGLILCGQEEPLNDNIRGFWYGIADPLYLKFGLYGQLNTGDEAFRHFLELRAVKRGLLDFSDLRADSRAKKTYIQDLCGDCLQEFVEQRIFRYQGPFQFHSHIESAGLIGSRASLLFFVEKEGLKDKYCYRYFEKYNISVLWGEGQPSLLTCECFGDQLLAKKVRRIAFAGLVDYDPAGYAIARTYPRHFEKLGFEVKGFTILTTTALFTEKALAEYSEDIDLAHPKKKAMNDAWFKETNGINGQRRAIHVNKAMMSRVDKAVDAWYQKAIEL